MSLQDHYGRLTLSRRVAVRTLVAFLLTFGALRIITAIIHYDLLPNGPFRFIVTRSGLHIHHLFWGILLLMITGFAALGTRDPSWHLRIAVVFGVALGLTLDEFAMWLRLADVYWSPEGIESIKAGAVATALLAVYAFGQPFWHALVRFMLGRKIVLAFAIIACGHAALAGASADPKREWKDGIWRDADRTLHTVRTNIVSGTAIGGCVITPDGDKALAFQTCVIEHEASLYFVRKHLNFRASDTVPITVNAPARFSVVKDVVYVIGNDGKEYKVDLIEALPKKRD